MNNVKMGEWAHHSQSMSQLCSPKPPYLWATWRIICCYYDITPWFGRSGEREDGEKEV